MHVYKVFRASVLKFLAVLLLIAVLVPAPAFSLDSEDSKMFITGFNAYQRKDYKSAVQTMSSLLKKYPETPLKDMAIFWLARANYRAGNKNEAAKYMAQFFRDYPDNPLKGTVEEELVQLAENYGAGQKPAAGAAVAQKAPAETVASEKVVPEQAGAEESAATEKAAADKLAAEKLAAEKLAAEKLAADKAAAERAATAKAAAEKAEADRLAAEKAAAEKMAAERAAAERMAAEKSAQDKAAAEKAAAEKAAAERVAQEKASAERAAAEKAAADRAAAERLAAEKAAAEKLAAEKALAEKAAADKAAAEKAAAERGAEQEKIAMRNKAIDAYKGVVDKFPGSAAAANATAKLRQLGIEYPAPKQMAATRPAETSQVFNLEVAQYANLDVRVGPVPETEEAGKQFIIPIDVVNTGNGNDSFYLESGFPRDFDFHFAAPGTPDIPINTTPTLANGEKFRMVAVGTIPRSNIDGQRNTYPIKIVSSFAHEASQSREIELATSAPLLRAVVKTDKPKLVPGEKVSYRISLLNIGTAPARGVTMRVNYPPQYEPVGAVASGFKQESKAALVLDSVQLKSGESKDFNLAFQLKDEALADQELFLRADVINNDLEKRDSFVSATSVVQKVSGVAVRTTAGKLVVIPGQVVAVPLIVTNTGNSREVFAIKANVGGGATYTFFDDLNRDGKRQANEPIINHVGPLSPKEEAYVVLEIATPASANDGQVASASVSFEPENAPERVASTDVQLTFSRPILELSMAAKGGRLKPGEVSSLDLNCVNRGTNMAKQVTLESVLPNQLELVAADPAFTRADNGVYSWRFDELGAGETRSIKVTYRVKPGTAVGTNMQLKNLLNYQDQIGNRY